MKKQTFHEWKNELLDSMEKDKDIIIHRNVQIDPNFMASISADTWERAEEIFEQIKQLKHEA